MRLHPLQLINDAVSTVTDAIDEAQALPGKLIQKATDSVVNSTNLDGLTDKKQGLKSEIPELGTAAGVVGTDVKNTSSSLDKFKEGADNFNVDYDARTNKGLTGLLQNVAESITGAASSFISNLVPGGISSSEQERISILEKFDSGNNKDKKEGVKTLVSKSPNVSERMKEILAEDPNTSTTLDMQIKMQEEAKRRGVPDKEIQAARTRNIIY